MHEFRLDNRLFGLFLFVTIFERRSFQRVFIILAEVVFLDEYLLERMRRLL